MPIAPFLMEIAAMSNFVSEIYLRTHEKKIQAIWPPSVRYRPYTVDDRRTYDTYDRMCRIPARYHTDWSYCN